MNAPRLASQALSFVGVGHRLLTVVEIARPACSQRQSSFLASLEHA